MKRILCRLFISLILLVESNYSWALIGKLSVQNDNLKLVTKNSEYSVLGDTNILNESKSMAYLDTLVFIDSHDQVSDNILYIKDVPTAVSGSERLSGVLVKQGDSLYLKVADQKILVMFIKPVDFRG
ncbi:hypothetical protein AB4F11_05860, partial [Francisella philomiragia]